MDHLEWTYDGAFEQLSATGVGNLNKIFPKIQMPGGLPGRGMFKLRFDWYIMYQSTSPLHRATPRGFEFLKKFCSIFPLTGPKSCSNAPTPGKISRLLFKLFSGFCLYASVAVRANMVYYPTAPRRVQITPKTRTNITRYLYSRGPVRHVCLLLTNQLARFPAPIPFCLAYFCRAFPVNKYLRNSPTRT